MSLKLYLLRHGETPYSRSGSFCGALDPDLTPEGKQMAEAFAAAYAGIPWQALYVSPMRRALATLSPLAEKVGLEMQIREGLREIHYGEWEGKTHAEAQEAYPEAYWRWMTEPAWNAPPGGETAVQIANRAMPVVAEIQEKWTGGHVLIVSHKATIRVILCSLLGIDLGRYRDRIEVLAASVSVVKFDRYGPLLEILGERSYLPSDLRERAGT
ncbi:histidine phosphatase family protein [Thermostichus sp. OS-CIW-26]|jgi:probable phosphoglycerate mutase